MENIGGMGLSPLETDKKKDATVTRRLLENAKQQYTELILQQMHRPSVFCWSMSNEVRREYGDTAARILHIRWIPIAIRRLPPIIMTAINGNRI